MAAVEKLMSLGYGPPPDETLLQINGTAVSRQSIPPLGSNNRPAVFSMDIDPLKDAPPNSIVSAKMVSPINPINIPVKDSISSYNSPIVSSGRNSPALAPLPNLESVTRSPRQKLPSVTRIASQSPNENYNQGWSSVNMDISGVHSMDVRKGATEITLPNINPRVSPMPEPAPNVLRRRHVPEPTAMSQPNAIPQPAADPFAVPSIARPALRAVSPIAPSQVPQKENLVYSSEKLVSAQSSISAVDNVFSNVQVATAPFVPLVSNTISARQRPPRENPPQEKRERNNRPPDRYRRKQKRSTNPKPKKSVVPQRYRRPDYKNLTDDERGYYEGELMNNYNDLTFLYPQLKLPESLPEDLDLDGKHTFYETCLLRSFMSNKTNKYKFLLILLCLGVELVFTKLIHVKAGGFTTAQWNVLNRYERLIHEIVKKRSQSFGEGWSPEVTIAVATLATFLCQIGRNYFEPLIGSYFTNIITELIKDFLLGEDAIEEEETNGGIQIPQPQNPNRMYNQATNIAGQTGSYFAGGAQDNANGLGGGIMNILGGLFGQGQAPAGNRPNSPLAEENVGSEPLFMD